MTESGNLKPVRELSSDSLKAAVYANRQAMGKAAALYVIDYLKELQKSRDEIRIVVGSAPSQDEFY